MKFFRVRPEDKAAIKQFRENCVKDGIEVYLSRRSITALATLANRKSGEDLEEINSQIVHTLSRRGMIRQDADGEWWITEIGLLTVALAESGGLLIKKNINDVK